MLMQPLPLQRLTLMLPLPRQRLNKMLLMLPLPRLRLTKMQPLLRASTITFQLGANPSRLIPESS